MVRAVSCRGRERHRRDRAHDRRVPVARTESGSDVERQRRASSACQRSSGHDRGDVGRRAGGRHVPSPLEGAGSFRRHDGLPADSPCARHRLRQGRRRQVVGDGQPRRSPGRPRVHRRGARRRRLGPLRPAPARHGRRDRGTGQEDGAAQSRRSGEGVVRVVSMGFFSGEDEAIMWRGLVLNRAVQHFLEDVHWGDLDYLLVDLPPGPATCRWGSPACCRGPRCCS